jgi:hypothetical protein
MLLLALLMGALVCGACAGRKTEKAQPKPARTSSAKAPVVVPSKALTGKVLQTNRNARFAVLVFPLGQMPANDQILSVYRDGLKVGEVKVTGPQRDDKTVADVMTGEAEVGDQVSDR